jgi:hypothetical protein
MRARSARGARPRPAMYQLHQQKGKGEARNCYNVTTNSKSQLVTSAVAAPVYVNGVLFENGIIDTGASNTFISQNVARKLDTWDDITPCAANFMC